METDEVSVVLPPSTLSGLSLSLCVVLNHLYSHPLIYVRQPSTPYPEYIRASHTTKTSTEDQRSFRYRPSLYLLVSTTDDTIVLGALLGTQNGREVDIVNTFELAVQEGEKLDHVFFNSRRDQCTFITTVTVALLKSTHSAFVDKQVFPSLEFIGWYSVASVPTARHIALHEQVRRFHFHFFLLFYIRSYQYFPTTISSSQSTAPRRSFFSSNLPPSASVVPQTVHPSISPSRHMNLQSK